jgi:hypothetical protein
MSCDGLNPAGMSVESGKVVYDDRERVLLNVGAVTA